MISNALSCVVVNGSPHRDAITRVVLREVCVRLQSDGAVVNWVDLAESPWPLFNPETGPQCPQFLSVRALVETADVMLLGTPDYHGCMSGTLKNFLDYFWKELAGKLFVPLVASHEKGLTVIDQIRTVARQCYAWVLPYGVSFADQEDVREGQIVSGRLKERLEMTVRDTGVYGSLLAVQRRADLAGTGSGFMARYRA